jgi:hypothetical protein
MSDMRDRILQNLTDSAGRPTNPAGAVAAIRAILELHQPVHRHAGVLAERFGEGRCAYCRADGVTAGATPLKVYFDYLNGSPRKVEMHCHGVQSEPWCAECRHPDDDSAAWPCAHVVAIGRALGEAP